MPTARSGASLCRSARRRDDAARSSRTQQAWHRVLRSRPSSRASSTYCGSGARSDPAGYDHRLRRSHTSTHGAFGAIAFGIGRVRSGCACNAVPCDDARPKVRRIQVNGRASAGCLRKGHHSAHHRRSGCKGRIGYAYELPDPRSTALSMEGRMTICNMSIEGGARVGYVNPDETTYDYIRGVDYAPAGEAFERAVPTGQSIAKAPDAEYDDEYELDASTLEPMVTWGINPGSGDRSSQGCHVRSSLEVCRSRRWQAAAYVTWISTRVRPIAGTPINVAFIGSCTNSRLGSS